VYNQQLLASEERILIQVEICQFILLIGKSLLLLLNLKLSSLSTSVKRYKSLRVTGQKIQITQFLLKLRLETSPISMEIILISFRLMHHLKMAQLRSRHHMDTSEITSQFQFKTTLTRFQLYTITFLTHMTHLDY